MIINRLTIILCLFLAALPQLSYAETLTNGGVQTGSIVTSGDTDSFTFDAAVGDSFILKLGDTGTRPFFPG